VINMGNDGDIAYRLAQNFKISFCRVWPRGPSGW